MDIQYRNATIEDLDFLVESRLKFIDIKKDNLEYSDIKGNIAEYFIQALNEQQCDIIFATNGASIIGTGIVFYYNSVPSQFNMQGKNAYITSMFVEERFRRKDYVKAKLKSLLAWPCLFLL